MKIGQQAARLLFSLAFCGTLMGGGEFSKDDFVPTEELLTKLREMSDTETTFIKEAKRLTLVMYLSAIKEYEKYNETSRNLEEIANIVNAGKHGTHSDLKFKAFSKLIYTDVKNGNREAYDIIGGTMMVSQQRFMEIKTNKKVTTRDVLVLMKDELNNLDKAVLKTYKKLD